MGFWSRLLGSQKPYTSKDQAGTRYIDEDKASAAWMSQGMMVGKGVSTQVNFVGKDGSVSREVVSKGSPFVCFVFDGQADAEKAIGSLSFIRKAEDTGELISLEVLEYGYFSTRGSSEWEVLIWGAALALPLFEEAVRKLGIKGREKGTRAPEPDAAPAPAERDSAGKASRVKHVSTQQKGLNTYEVHRAPGKADALAWLREHPVTEPLYYRVVETAEGNWGRDVNGIYQE